MTELKPCEDGHIPKIVNSYGLIYVYCLDGVSLHQKTKYHTSEQEAVDAWNNGERAQGYIAVQTLQGFFVVSAASITKIFFKDETVSKRLLVRKHYKEVEASLWITTLLKEGKTYESITAFYHKESDLKDAPHLAQCLDPLENQLNLMTDGEYDAVVAVLQNDSHNWRDLNDHKYWGEIQDIWLEIKKLRDGRYYENEIFHRPGIPRIETTGDRLVEKIMDLVWKMDNDLPNMWYIDEETKAKMEAFDSTIIPKIDWED